MDLIKQKEQRFREDHNILRIFNITKQENVLSANNDHFYYLFNFNTNLFS